MGLNINKTKHPNCYDGYKYALNVLNNKLIVPKITRHAVERYFTDIDRASRPDSPFYIDLDYAERFMRVTQKFQHVKGANWPSKYILYADWQKFGYLYLFSFMSSITKKRRFRTASFWEPRGQGKSTRAAQIGLYMLALDKEVGPDIYCASTKKDSARLVLDSARYMAIKNQGFIRSTGTNVLAHTIVHPASNGIMKAVSSDTSTNDGWNCSLIIADELHEWKRELYDLADSSLTKRNDSLFLTISTAGFNTSGIGHEVFSYSKKVLKGEVIDDTWFSLIYEMDEDDDWQDPLTWKKANPNWGVSVDPINFEAKAKKAAQSNTTKNAFLVKHLNRWTNSASPFFDLNHWDNCADPTLRIDQFSGEVCAMGLDLATKVDLCSKGYIFKRDDIYYVFDKSYIPEARLNDTKNVLFEKCISDGSLISMKGEVIDFELIQNSIMRDHGQFKLMGVNTDPWAAAETIQKLQKSRVPVYECRMNTANLSEPMKKLDALIRERKIRHNGSPLLRWCLGNVVAKMDANDNVFPRKEHERLKIDPIIALIMAMGLWVVEDMKTSIYETRGLRCI